MKQNDIRTLTVLATEVDMVFALFFFSYSPHRQKNKIPFFLPQETIMHVKQTLVFSKFYAGLKTSGLFTVGVGLITRLKISQKCAWNEWGRCLSNVSCFR